MTKQIAEIRILHLLQILYDQTDEQHPLTTSELTGRLAASGVKCSRRTVTVGISLLTDLGVNIITHKGRQNSYFVAERRFELPELRLLIDAVGSSRFITAKKSQSLIGKLKTLASIHLSSALEQHLYLAERVKTSNEAVYYTVDTVATAIYHQCKITFQYIEYTPDKEAVYKHNGKVYVFSPYDMIWNDDRYYAVGWSDSHGKVITFRMDRMKNVKSYDRNAHPRPQEYEVSTYTKEVFEMFPGRLATVELSCTNELMKVIVDRFGEDVQTERVDAERFKATVDVSVSPTFFGWILQFSGRIKILSPMDVREQMNCICQDAIS